MWIESFLKFVAKTLIIIFVVISVLYFLGIFKDTDDHVLDKIRGSYYENKHQTEIFDEYTGRLYAYEVCLRGYKYISTGRGTITPMIQADENTGYMIPIKCSKKEK